MLPNYNQWCFEIECHVADYAAHKKRQKKPTLSIGNWFKYHTLSYQSFHDWRSGKCKPHDKTYTLINKIIAEEKGEIERARNV